MACGGGDLSVQTFFKVTLKPWLFEQIESGNYLGLQWEHSEDKTTFKLPWVKETDPNWREYYKLFHAWAERDGSKACEPCKAKRNFRAALDNSKHFSKSHVVPKQTGSYKVYKFNVTPQEKSGKTKKGGTPSPVNTDDMSMSYHFPMASSSQQQNDNVYPALMNNLNIDSRMHQQQHVPHLEHEMNLNIQVLTDISHNVPEIVIEIPMFTKGDGPFHNIDCNDVDMNNLSSLESERSTSMAMDWFEEGGISREELASCDYAIEYQGRHQLSGTIMNMENNSKFVYGNINDAKIAEQLNSSKNSPYFTEQLYELKEPYNITSELFIKALENMNTGISIWLDFKDLCIKVARHCITHVFSFNVVDGKDSKESHTLTLLERNKPYTIFSYKKFLFDHSKSSVIPDVLPPDIRVELIAGVRPSQRGVSSKGVKILFTPCAALKLLNGDGIDIGSLQNLCLSMEPSSLDIELNNMKIKNA